MRCRRFLCLSKGKGRATRDEGDVYVALGDTMSVTDGITRSAVPSMTGDVAMFHVVGTGDGEDAR